MAVLKIRKSQGNLSSKVFYPVWNEGWIETHSPFPKFQINRRIPVLINQIEYLSAVYWALLQLIYMQNTLLLNSHPNTHIFLGQVDPLPFLQVSPTLTGHIFNSAKPHENSGQDLQLKPKMKERTRIKAEVWSHSEVKKIFRLYTQYGSQWKIIQSEFEDRAANSIKNRFYTVVRTMLKLLFKWHPMITQKLPHEIPSKIILKFYEGRDEFAKFKGLGRRILKMVDYNLASKEIKKIAAENQQELLALYQQIFSGRRPLETNQEINRNKNEPEIPTDNVYQKNQQNLSHPDHRNQYAEPDPVKIQTCSTIPGSEFSLVNSCQGIVYLVPFTQYYPPFAHSYFPLF